MPKRLVLTSFIPKSPQSIIRQASNTSSLLLVWLKFKSQVADQRHQVSQEQLSDS